MHSAPGLEEEEEMVDFPRLKIDGDASCERSVPKDGTLECHNAGTPERRNAGIPEY